MAEFNSDEVTTMEDDFILEIVKPLPHQLGDPSSLLNMFFSHRISQPNMLPPPYSVILHCTSGFDGIARSHTNSLNQSYFSCIWREIRSNSTINHPVRRSETLHLNVRIIACCNGLLLLRFDNPYTHYFFNPATSEIAAAPSRNLAGFYKTVGLAVNKNWFSPIKLVTAKGRANGWIKFTVVVPSPTGSGGYSRYEVNFYSHWRYGQRRLKTNPVHAHGSLYWLSCLGEFLVAFDVEKDKARLIEAPPDCHTHNKCLGVADGEIHLVYGMRSGIVIYGHDHSTDGWRVKCRISTSELIKPFFFDGELLLFMGREFSCYDLKREVRKDIGIPLQLDENWHFFSFQFSFAKLFYTYLNENNTSLWKNEGRRNALLELQKFLWDY